MKTIAVLTSGGDAPGMNAAIRAAVRTGCENNVKMLGIRRGFKGLMEGDMYEMNLRSVSDIIQALVIVFTVAGLAMVKLPEFKALLNRVFSRKEVA